MIKAHQIATGDHLILKSGSKVVVTHVFPNKKENGMSFCYRYQTKGSDQIGDLAYMHPHVSFTEEFEKQ